MKQRHETSGVRESAISEVLYETEREKEKEKRKDQKQQREEKEWPVQLDINDAVPRMSPIWMVLNKVPAGQATPLDQRVLVVPVY